MSSVHGRRTRFPNIVGDILPSDRVPIHWRVADTVDPGVRDSGRGLIWQTFPVIFRLAHPAEAPLLSELALRSKRHWGYDDDFMNRCRPQLMVDPDQITRDRVTLVEGGAEGAIMGFYALAGSSDDDGEISMLFVDPPWIGTGLGAHLLEHASLTARHLGWSAVRIEADPFAAPFYEHMGAVRIGDVRSELIAGRTLPLLRMPLGSG